jgi:hypothetical protein
LIGEAWRRASSTLPSIGVQRLPHDNEFNSYVAATLITALTSVRAFSQPPTLGKPASPAVAKSETI